MITSWRRREEEGGGGGGEEEDFFENLEVIRPVRFYDVYMMMYTWCHTLIALIQYDVV